MRQPFEKDPNQPFLNLSLLVSTGNNGIESNVVDMNYKSIFIALFAFGVSWSKSLNKEIGKPLKEYQLL